jgi:hypothetical protein
VKNLAKYVRLYPSRDTSTKGVKVVLNEFIERNGLLEGRISDRGTAFTSQAIKDSCSENGVEHLLVSTRHPRTNGQVQRVNRTVLPVIASAMTDPGHRDWDKKIKLCESYLNCAVNSSTK